MGLFKYFAIINKYSSFALSSHLSSAFWPCERGLQLYHQPFRGLRSLFPAKNYVNHFRNCVTVLQQGKVILHKKF